jgi:hypothetical protein
MTLLRLCSVVRGLSRLSTGDDQDEFDKLRARHGFEQPSYLLKQLSFLNLLDGGHWPRDVIHEIRVDRRPETTLGFIREGQPKQSAFFATHATKSSMQTNLLWNGAAAPDQMKFLNGTVSATDWRRLVQ